MNVSTEYSQQKIGKYISYCKLRAEIRTGHEPPDVAYTMDCAKCLEKYYMRCLKDVYGKQDMSVCEKIVDAYKEVLYNSQNDNKVD